MDFMDPAWRDQATSDEAAPVPSPRLSADPYARAGQVAALVRRTPMHVIDTRTAELRRVLEACTEEGIDPLTVSVSMTGPGRVTCHLGCTAEDAAKVLARLTGEEQVPYDYPNPTATTPFSTLTAGGYQVFCQLRSEAEVPR